MTPDNERRLSPFRASHGATLDLLSSELEKLKATDVVFELAMQERDIRVDGMPRANARAPEHPGVVVSFGSIHGPLRYATDTFTTWQANLRGIALGLEALRQVERYGITKRGEQYVGWKAIMPVSESREDAISVLWEYADGTSAVIPHNVDVKHLVRVARRVTHPDKGGSRDNWEAVQRAARTLGL